MTDILLIILVLVSIKAIIIGSDFNIILWIKHGGAYWYWYQNREEFKP